MRGLSTLTELACVLYDGKVEEFLPRKYRNVSEDNQSQESKDYHLKLAEEKRKRKAERNKR